MLWHFIAIKRLYASFFHNSPFFCNKAEVIPFDWTLGPRCRCLGTRSFNRKRVDQCSGILVRQILTFSLSYCTFVLLSADTSFFSQCSFLSLECEDLVNFVEWSSQQWMWRMSQQLSQRLQYVRAGSPKHIQWPQANEVYRSWSDVSDMAVYNGTMCWIFQLFLLTKSNMS